MKPTRGDRIARATRMTRAGRWADARALLDADSDGPDAITLLDRIETMLAAAARQAEAAARAIRSNPRESVAHHALGVALMAQGRHEEALGCFAAAIAERNDFAAPHVARGSLLGELARYEEGVASLDIAIRLNPAGAEAWRLRGLWLWVLGRLDAALENLDAAILRRPDLAMTHTYRGIVLRALGRPEDALASLDRAIAADPNDPEPHYEAAKTWMDLKHIERAIECNATALALRPDYQLAHWNHGIYAMLLGRFEAGWREFEWRLDAADERLANRARAWPAWTGREDTRGKTVFLYYEQGAGDTFQFYRFARRVRALGAKVVLAVRESQIRLLREADPAIAVIGPDDDPGPVDFQASLMSVPFALEAAGAGGVVSAPYLRADDRARAEWTGRLGPKTKPRIGIVWSGNPVHANDRARSIDAATFFPLLCPAAEWVCLQNAMQIEALKLSWMGGPEVRYFGADLTDFAETAGLIDAMDLTIAVDTAVAHLAGAMGKAVWILLPFVPDWRWQIDGIDSPWYSSARLFRQTAPGDWPGVFRRVEAALRRFLAVGA